MVELGAIRIFLPSEASAKRTKLPFPWVQGRFGP
jgi:hypothetical protein